MGEYSEFINKETEGSILLGKLVSYSDDKKVNYEIDDKESLSSMKQQIFDFKTENFNLDDNAQYDRLSLYDYLYALEAFWVTSIPVASCIIVSCLINIINPNEMNNTKDLKVFKFNDDDISYSNSEKLGMSLINAFVMICYIGIVTFVVVLLYYFKCSSFLIGYLFLSSAALLMLVGGTFFLTAIIRFSIPMDSITFSLLLYNFAAVGVYAIFFKKGMPKIIIQSYLVVIAVLVTWNISNFDDWSIWSLLVMLCLYDLFAVLAPIGPLRLLVGIMQQRPKEALPGLLYEAEFSSNLTTSNEDSHDIEIADSVEENLSQKITRKIDLTDEIDSSSPLSNSSTGYIESPEKSVKLGLGDFVFYSVLVSRAAKSGFLPFLSCFVMIFLGLGSTIFLLAVYKRALPALPISIICGVFAYFGTKYIIVPSISTTENNSIYF